MCVQRCSATSLGTHPTHGQVFALLCWPTVMTPSRHRRLVLAYDSNPSSDGSVLVSATPPARHHYCPPTPLRPPSSHPSPLEPPAACGNCAPTSPQSRVESGHALSHTITCHLSTSWRIRMNISRCVPGRERPRGCIVPTRTPARARRRSGANGASGASSSMSIISAASRHPRGAARPKQVSHGRCPASAAAGLREPQGVNRSSRFESYLTNGVSWK